MNKRLLNILLATTGVTITVVLIVVGPPQSWSTPAKLQVIPAALPQQPLSAASEVSLSGTGLTSDTRVWLVPEVTDRVAHLATLHTWGNPTHLVLRNNVAYVANKVSGLLIADISDSRSPRTLGALDTPGQVMRIALGERIICLADGKGGVRIVDVDNPEQPRELSVFPTIALSLVIRGDYVYVAMGRDGLLVLDISNPRHPRRVAQLVTSSPLIEVALHMDRLLLGYIKGAEIARLDNPAQPVFEQALPVEGMTRGFASHGSELFVVTRSANDEVGGNLFRVDLTNPALPRLRSSTPLYGFPNAVICEGNRLLVCLESNGVQFFDCSDPGQLLLSNSLDLPFPLRGLSLAGDVLWVVDGYGSIQSMDVNKKVVHPFVAEMRAPTAKYAIVVGDGRLYEADERRVILFVRTATGDYVRRGSCSLPGDIVDMVERGNYLFVSCNLVGNRGVITVVDCRNPDQLRSVADISVDHPPRRLALEKGLLIASEGPAYYAEDKQAVYSPPYKVKLIDVTTPSAPFVMNSIEVESLVAGADLHSGILCLVLSNGVIRLYDVEDPSRPLVLGQSELPWLHGSRGYSNADVHLTDKHVTITTLLGGVKVFDLSNLYRPVLLGAFDPGGVVKQSIANGDLLFLNMSRRGVLVLDMGRPHMPMPIGEIPLMAPWNCLAVEKNRIWFVPGAGSGVGIRVISWPIPVPVEVAADGQGLALTVPQVAASGDYAVWVQNRNGWVELPAALHIKAD